MPVILQEEHLGTLSSLASSITLPATYTINIWVKNVTLPGQEWSNLYLQNSGYKYILDANYGAIGAGTGPTRLAVSAADPLLVADTFHLVSCVFDGTTIEYYVNGVSIGSTTPAGAAPTVIDVLNGPGGQGFAAEVKDMRVYSGVATAGEILVSFNNGDGDLLPPSLTDGLVAKYPLTFDISDDQGAYDGFSPQNIGDPVLDLTLGTHVTDFDSSYFGIDNDLYNGFDTEYSFSMWMKPETIAHSWVMANEQHGTYYGTWGVVLQADGQLQLFVRDANGGAYDIALTGVSLVVDEWSHVAATWSGTEIKWYVNGEPASTTLASRVPYNSPATLWIGANATKPNATKYYFDGKMSDLRFWHSELSSTEVEELYNNGANPQGENNNMGQITFTFSGLMYDGWESEGTWRLMQGATVWDSGTLASLGLAAGEQLVITADNVPTTNIAGGVPIRLEVSDVYQSALGDGMFQPLGAGNLLTMVGSGAGGVSSSSTFTFSEADSRLLENTGYVADTSGFYVQWYSSGMDNSWGPTGDYSTGQLPQDGSVVTWHNEIVAANPPPAPPAPPAGVVRTRVHHDQLRMPSHDEYEAELAGVFATPTLAVEGGASHGSLQVDGLPLEYFGLDINVADYGARDQGVGEMIVNKKKLDSDIMEMQDLISDEETRALAAEGVLQGNIDAVVGDLASYESSNDAALAVETGRIDALLSGSGVDLDQLVELVAAYELADTDIISSIATLQADVNTNESDADDGFAIALMDRNMIQTELTEHKGAYASKMILLDQEDLDIRADFASADVQILAEMETESLARQAAEATIQADVNQNELDGDTDRALIRSEFAQADADALAASIVREDALDAALSADISAVSASLLSYETAHDALYAAEVSARQTLESEYDAYVISNDAALATEVADRTTLEGEFDAYVISNDAALSVEVGRASAAEGVLQGNIDAVVGDLASYESSNDAAVGVERGRIDALLSGSGVDLDQLVELVAAYELADTDIISSITNLQGDVDANEADADQAMVDEIAARILGDSVERGFALAARTANETARDASVEVIRAALQGDVDGNEQDGDDDRALIRSEMAAFETARDASVEAIRAALEAAAEEIEEDAQEDRALIRTEMAANETARDASEAAAILVETNRALGVEAGIQSELTALKDGSTTIMSEVDTDISNMKDDLIAIHDRFQVTFLNPLTQDFAPGEAISLIAFGMDEMSEIIHLTLNGLVMNPYSEVSWIVDGVSGNITGFASNVDLYEGDVISCFGIKAYDLVS